MNDVAAEEVGDGHKNSPDKDQKSAKDDPEKYRKAPSNNIVEVVVYSILLITLIVHGRAI